MKNKIDFRYLTILKATGFWIACKFKIKLYYLIEFTNLRMLTLIKRLRDIKIVEKNQRLRDQKQEKIRFDIQIRRS